MDIDISSRIKVGYDVMNVAKVRLEVRFLVTQIAKRLLRLYSSSACNP